ncbi:MAG: HAD family hydrolase [Candidatus Bathyarchaeota archaeon]|nr:HAD family hydrolase [Candidatus Bathyarchaeota archaeon]MDH5788130.1 HAD family hydrolase [Candidatus Bathyarchaeota archaeon]
MKSSKLKVKAILLDLDGTIVDSKEAYLEAVEAAFATIKQKIVNAKTVTEIPKRLEQNLPISDIIKADTRKFLEIYLKTYYKATATKAKPLPNVDNALEKLSQKAKLALITMRCVPKRKIMDELENFGLEKYFQHIMTALDTRNPKPAPDALIECARQLGIQTRDCIFVGDSVADVKAGKNAGVKTVAVLSGIFSRKELEKEKPDLILENVNQLPGFLE